MNLQRGSRRLGLSLTTGWFVFWTFAYVLRAPVSENYQQPPGVDLSPASVLAAPLVVAGIIIFVRWIVDGLRTNSTTGTTL